MGSHTMEFRDARVPVDLIRHAHGVHNDPILPVKQGSERDAANWVRILKYNVNGDLITDPPLSTAGMAECENFRNDIILPNSARFRNSIIAVSPFQRNLMSSLLMFAPILEERDENCRFIILDPALQERNNAGCNLGSSTNALRAAFEKWTHFEEGDADMDEITIEDLIQAWLESDECKPENLPLTDIWIRRGWVTPQQVEDCKDEPEGKSALGDAIMAREVRRRLAKFPSLSKVKLLVVGDDITEADWIEKRDMVYHPAPKRCFAPFPDLFVKSLSQARRNMATRWAEWIPQWQKQHPGFKSWDDSVGVVGIIHSGLTAALVRQWGSFRLPKSDKLDPCAYQITSHDILEEFRGLKAGDRWIVPRLELRPHVYGFWTYSRQDSCKLEWIQGSLKKEEDGWQVVETPESLERRTARHLVHNERQVRWFTDEENKLWDTYIVGCIMAPGYVFKARLGDELRKPENVLSIEFGGWDSDPLQWKFFMGDKETDFTLGTCGADKISLRSGEDL